MVVMWCSCCSALMGMREPMNDWRVEKGVCANCLSKLLEKKPPDIPAVPEEGKLTKPAEGGETS